MWREACPHRGTRSRLGFVVVLLRAVLTRSRSLLRARFRTK
ncbi:hypothetical protein SMD44_04962 [Streptomyces alboflavus]|uniref:Uncharacterized protein n=1 Tax=Streptomyces alboflavus TaxID=67267 RepID=A0A1Z1WGI6_9ACTN|nr:hypothetical protein SMD44_04962 [Streptomyces alboflavus]